MKNLKAKTISVLLTFMAFSNSLIISNAIENKLDTINDEEQNLELIQGTTNEDSEQITNDTNNIEDTSTFSAISSKELEPNDNISQANTISVGKKYSGVTDKYGYPDYYKFTLSQDGYIDINFNQNQNVRFKFEIYKESQTSSYETYSTPYGSSTTKVRLGLAKGTYYLKVYKYSNGDSNTQYSFSVNATATNYWEKEFNDSFNSSDNITIGNTYNGITDRYGNPDYYKFTVSKDGYIDINFNENQNARFKFELYNEARERYGIYSTPYGSSTTKVREGLAKGTYYLKVYKYLDGDSNTQYSFSVNTTATNYWEKEFNDSFNSSNNIIVSKTYNGITDTYGDPDYYKFTVSQAGSVDINFEQNKNVRFKFELYNEAKERYGTYNTESGSGTKVQKVSLKKGTNYLKVYKYNSGEPNTQYSFSVGSPSVKKSKLIGDDRYKTAIKVSNRGWTKADNVVLVNSSAIVDALSATPFAKMKNAPILLTEKDKLNEDTKKEITRLCAKNVYVIGGTSIISGNIVSELKSMNLKVERISGDTRYTTSLAIAKKLGTVSEIAVVNGVTGLADAVSIAPVAASKKMPIILASPDTGTKAFDEYIKSNNIKTSYVIGGENAISKDVASKLPNVKRLGGSSRNETNALILEKFYTNKDLNNVFVAKDGMAKANDLIDALAVGVLAAKENSPLVIVGNQLDAKQEKVLLTKKPKEATQVGGNGNENVYNQIINLY